MTDYHVRDAYAAVAERYIATFGSIEQVHTDDLVFISRHLGKRHGAVLDVGCGPGHLTGYLRALGIDVMGGMAATPDNLLTMVRRLPDDAVWQVIAIGRHNLELTAIGLAVGGNARVAA